MSDVMRAHRQDERVWFVVEGRKLWHVFLNGRRREEWTIVSAPRMCPIRPNGRLGRKIIQAVREASA